MLSIFNLTQKTGKVQQIWTEKSELDFKYGKKTSKSQEKFMDEQTA